MNGMTYVVNDDNIIVRKFECDYDSAIQNTLGKITPEGRYFILPKGFKPPYEEIKKVTFDKKKFPKKL